MPFLGFPSTWENFINFISGLTLVSLSFSVAAKRRASARKIKRTRKENKGEFFVDGGLEIESSAPSPDYSKEQNTM